MIDGPLKGLDLFAGLQGWSEPFRERGHDMLTLDIDPSFEPDLALDIFDFKPSEHLPKGWRPDIVLASPPCEGFTVMTIGRNWTGPKDDPPHSPKTAQARLSLAIVERTREIIEELEPSFFVIENPRAKLRALPVLSDVERITVHYCKYGEEYMKPTDLWGGFPVSWSPRQRCIIDRDAEPVVIDGVEWRVDTLTGEPCHRSAPRGSRTGIQGDTPMRGKVDAKHKRGRLAAERAKIPAELARSICLSAERDR